MSPGARPQLGHFGARTEHTPCCPRGHEKRGYNLLPNGACRACFTAHRWASYHDLFYDDPRVLARADELAGQYLADSDLTRKAHP
jgi:hypothetical protein